MFWFMKSVEVYSIIDPIMSGQNSSNHCDVTYGTRTIQDPGKDDYEPNNYNNDNETVNESTLMMQHNQPPSPPQTWPEPSSKQSTSAYLLFEAAAAAVNGRLKYTESSSEQSPSARAFHQSLLSDFYKEFTATKNVDRPWFTEHRSYNHKNKPEQLYTDVGGGGGFGMEDPSQNNTMAERLQKIRDYFSNMPNQTGSWAQFFDRKQFSVPSTLTEVTRRCPDNVQVFFSNYCCISIVLLVYCLVTSPLLLIGLSIFTILFYMIIKRNEELVLFGQKLTRNQQLIGLSVFSFPFLFLLGLTKTIFWLIGATTFVVALHSIFHESPKLTVDQMNEGNEAYPTNSNNGDQNVPPQASTVFSV